MKGRRGTLEASPRRARADVAAGAQAAELPPESLDLCGGLQTAHLPSEYPDLSALGLRGSRAGDGGASGTEGLRVAAVLLGCSWEH